MAADAGAGTAVSTRRVTVTAESTCCLPRELAEANGIGIVPVPFVFGSTAFLDGVDISPEQFYERLVATRVPPKTSPPAPGAYLSAWLGAPTDAVLHVTTAARITTFMRSVEVAEGQLPSEAPGRTVAIVDSGSAGMGQGFVALAAARAAAGESLEAAAAAAEAVRRRVKLVVALDTLEYLARTSRIPQVAALFGGLLAIKPIILVADGDVRPLARVRTRRRSIEQLVATIVAMASGSGKVHVAVQHARAADEAADLARRLAGELDCAEMLITEFTPVMGAYCGPGLIGAAFYTEAGEAV